MEKRSQLSFSALLKRHRRIARLTQEQLAEQAGYSVSYISMLERGERAPVRATVELLAEALALTASERALLEAAARDRDTLAVVPAPPSFSRITVPSPPLAGRAAEVGHIERHLVGEGPPLLLIAGEPGIGKSRLLAEARTRGEASGWATLAGSSQRGGAQQPFTPLLEALERHVGELPEPHLRKALTNAPWLTRLLPELAAIMPPPRTAWALPPEQERRLLFSSVASYLTAVSGHLGALLILDDLQWAGADALDLLESLLRSPSAARLRVIGAYRDADLPPVSPLATHLADLAASGMVTHLPVGPLSHDEAAALVSEALPEARRDQASVEHIIARGGGVPFYLVSFAQSLTAQERATTSSEAANDVPWDIAQTIRQRIIALPQGSRELLEIAALAGRGVLRATLLAACAELSDEATLAVTLDGACRARLLLEEGEDGYAFAHELARDVVLHDIGQARRAALHARIAAALETRGGEKPAEALAYHFTRSGHPERALPYLAQSARRARAMQAFSSAVARYRELGESLDQLDRPREAAEAREHLGEALTVAGRYGEAIEALEEAARAFQALGADADASRLVARIGLAYAASSDAAGGISRLEPIAYAERDEPTLPAARAELWDALAQLYHVGGRYADQLAATIRASEFAQATDDTHLRAQVQIRHGNALRMLGRMGEATAVLEEAIRLAGVAGDEQNLAYALENVSVVYLLQGRLRQTEVYVQRALDLSQHLGDPIVLALMTLRRGMTAYVLGQWDAALADYERADAMMREVGVAWVSAYTAIGLGQLHLARGETEAGARLLAQAVELASRSGDLQALRWAQTALAEWDLLEGRPESARDRLESLLDRPDEQEGLVTYLLPYLAWACAQTGEAAVARQRLSMCLARAEAEHIHLALVDALRVDALLALASGAADSSTVESGLLRARDLCRAMPYPYAEAKVLFTLGSLYQARGDESEAQAHWAAASAVLRQLGERLYAAHVERAERQDLSRLAATSDALLRRRPAATGPIPRKPPRPPR